MLWSLIMILAGVFAYFIIEKKLKTNVVSVKGIGIILIIFLAIEFIKYLVIHLL